MRIKRLVGLAILIGGVLLLAGCNNDDIQLGGNGDAPPANAINFQEDFDPLGPTVRAMQLDSGRTVYYIDEGKPSWETVVFIGGVGTTVRAFGLTEFLRTTREALQLRFISVGRNGLGQTPFDPSLGFDDYSKAVMAVLDRLGVEDFAIMAISGGGPYAAHLASWVSLRSPQRITSIHLAAAAPPYGPRPDYCGLSNAALAQQLKSMTHNPMKWWGGVAQSPTHKIPGWADTAYEEGARAFFVRGQMGDPSALVHMYKAYCQRPGPSLVNLTAPAYLYWGADDTTVPTSAIHSWRQALPNIAAVRVYAGIGHAVQYRHWGQVLVDIAGMDGQILVCRNGTSQLVPQQQLQKASNDSTTLGICAWTQDKQQL